MIEFIQRYWIEVIFGMIVAALSASYRMLSSKLKNKIKEQDAVKEGVLAILHDRLYQACRYFIGVGYCEIEDMKNIEYLYDAYHSLGGNGTGTELYSRVKSLPIKEKR